MAKTTEKNVIIPLESAEGLKANLRQVAEELTRIRDRTRQEVEDIERVRGMLDLKYLNDLLSVIDQLETRVRQVEGGQEAARWRQELETEQRRLAKLWDAFKTQEDQLNALERERDDILAEYRKVEQQFGTIGSPAKIKARLSELEAQNQRLRQESSLTAGKLEEYVRLFGQEQERLAKLYKVFEDTESRALRAEGDLKKFTKPEAEKPTAAKRARTARGPRRSARVGRGVRSLPLAQRRKLYRAELAEFVKRSKRARGGKGPFAKRPGAVALRKKYGIR